VGVVHLNALGIVNFVDPKVICSVSIVAGVEDAVIILGSRVDVVACRVGRGYSHNDPFNVVPGGHFAIAGLPTTVEIVLPRVLSCG
jgi:hypothetical protein